jgi:Leucine-rich repeat (LRR) protein
MQLHSQRNCISDLRSLVFAPKLESLALDDNQLSVEQWTEVRATLKSMPTLKELSLQVCCAASASTRIHVSFFSLNACTTCSAAVHHRFVLDLCIIHFVVSIKLNPPITHSTTHQGNPLSSDRDYRLIIIENAAQLTSLDHSPVRAYLRQQVFLFRSIFVQIPLLNSSQIFFSHVDSLLMDHLIR